MRAIWKGSVSFGLVNIPVALFPAVRREELKFRLLRQSDLSPINYKRTAEADGKEVPWDQIVKGYEYEKGKFVVLKDEDFKRADIEATQTIDIIDFVELSDVDPRFFQKPYFLEPQKSGASAYTLLRDVLEDSGKAGIAKVVIKTRQHLAAVKPQNGVLMLELLHFADELADPSSLKIPEAEKVSSKSREFSMARKLVDELTVNWKPENYTDDYTSALLDLIEQKIKKGGKVVGRTPARSRKSGDNVIDLVAILQESLKDSGAGRSKARGTPRKKVSKSKAKKKTPAAKKKKTTRKSARKAA